MSLITDNIELSAEFLLDFENLAKRNQSRLLEIVLDRLTELSSKKGTLSFSDDSTQEINDLIKQVYKEFGFEKYKGEISSLLRDVNKIGQSEINLASILTDNIDVNFSKQQNFIINELSERLASPDSFRANILGEVRRIIGRRIWTQAPISQLKSDLKAAFTGKDGQVTKYVNQIVVDGVNQYQGAINKEIKQKYNLDAYNYINSIIETSRPQCVRWVEKYGGILMIDTKKEGFGYLPTEVDWANKSGSGYGKGLTLTIENFAVVRGGYGCRHKAIPFKTSARGLARSERLKKEYDAEVARLKLAA